MKNTIIIFISCLFLFISMASYASSTIYINHPDSDQDTRYNYPQKLLLRILEVTRKEYGDFKLETNGISMNRTRALASLIEGKNLHVMAEAPKPDWTEQLLVIRIPIRKGIQGYRLFLTKKEHLPLLAQVKTFDDFKKLETGSGDQWSTTKVMEEAGFNVVKGVDYEGLFGMLVRDRFITFGRGINEIYEEYEQRKTALDEVVIDDRFLLYIPLPTYFFVSPKHPELKNRIETGLKQLIQTKEFDTIFEAEFGELIQKAKLDQRIKFSIPNPNLSKEDPLDIKEYWYSTSNEQSQTRGQN